MACDSFTVLMLHCDGADGSTSFPDSSISAKTVTAVGDAQVDTAQSKFGGASALFDGISDYLSVPDSADFDFSADFTIDFWVRFNSLLVSQALLDKQYTNAGGYLVEWGNDNTLLFYNNGAVQVTRSWTPSTATWYHVAVVRTGTVIKLFIDGTQLGADTTFTTDLSGSTAVLAIGFDLTDALLGFNGWIDEFRVSKGIARWTANFTPATSAYCASTFRSRLALLGAG